MDAVRLRRPSAVVYLLALALLLPGAAVATPGTVAATARNDPGPVADTAASPAAATLLPRRFARQLTYPANAMSHSGGASFQPTTRGIEWVGTGGMMSLTVRRPKDYAGGRVRVTLFYEVDSDESGTIRFIVTPVTFNSGNSFETYGSIGTAPRPAPETVNALLSSSATIESGVGGVAWGDGAWWYMDLVRAGPSEGGFPGKLRIMAVSLEY